MSIQLYQMHQCFSVFLKFFFLFVAYLLRLMDQKEMDCIVDQMMTVAEYLGWDVSELKPVSFDFNTKE